MYKLIISPEQASYVVTDGSEVVSTKLDGGASSYRRDIIGATSLVNCLWQIGPDDYTYLRMFYNSGTMKGSLPFLVDLLLDNPFTEEFTAHFVAGTMKLQQQVGNTYYVYAQLEVQPILADDEFNISYIEMVQDYGSIVNILAWLNEFETLSNVDLPNALEP